MKSVVYCMTRNLYEKAMPSIRSLYAHTKIDRLYMVIEDGAFPCKLPENAKIINVSDQRYFRKGGINYNTIWTYMVMIRGALAYLLPDDQVLSLDVDTIIHDDISSLWDYDLTGYYCAGARETRLTERKGHLYINFGVCMLNLAELRKPWRNGRTKTDDLIWYMDNVKYEFVEQDCHNQLCKGKILEIPSDYNVTGFDVMTLPAQHTYIRHYAGENNWYYLPEVQELARKKGAWE